MSHHPIRPGLADPRDFLGLDALLDDEERLDPRHGAAASSPTKVLPQVGDWFEAGFFPRELGREMGAMGLLGMHLEGYGCSGTSQRGLRPGLLPSWSTATRGTRSFVSVQGSLSMFPIWAYGSEEQKQQWLPAYGGGRADRLLRPDRGRRRQRPVGDAHGGQA